VLVVENFGRKSVAEYVKMDVVENVDEAVVEGDMIEEVDVRFMLLL
jgi:hypothetical protein